MSSEVENYDDSFEEEEYGDDDFETGSLDTGSQIVEEKSVQEQPVTQKQTNAKKNIPSTSPISKSTKREKSPSSKNTNRNSTEVEMLKIANDALRNQLREFAKALDVSLKQNKKMKESGLPGASKSMKVKAEMMKNMQKKIDVYKRANGELKRQLREMRDADKVVALENLVGQRDIEIKRLNRDNKALLSIQRSQAREMSARETAKSEWPQKIVSLENDIRVYREKLRKIRERDMKYMEERHEQTEKMADLVNPNYTKYFKMLSMHLPKGAVAQKMVAEGLDPAVLDMDPTGPAPSAKAEGPKLKDDPKFAKYFKMLKMHLPKGAVAQKMVAEGFGQGTSVDMREEKGG